MIRERETVNREEEKGEIGGTERQVVMLSFIKIVEAYVKKKERNAINTSIQPDQTRPPRLQEELVGIHRF
ncbi:hypothetical protein Pcinc_020234 [Petrolisthes cinctipes]|uniref:Uncharacterized protein n=1 Tax=Petrolisthes cinctipes TaxID=88211 RepID=A0AAE1FN68_PETCI|nr:hypothetical protein Pcinc_020234 [Petrolisthes cinctipes]